jgi:hypothetical protein
MEMADVILIFTPGECDRFDDESLALAFAATNIERLHSGALSCTVPAIKIHEIEKNPRVAYVRRVSAYMGSIRS